MQHPIERKLELIETRLDKSAEDSAYNQGRLDEIALTVSHIPSVVERQRVVKASVRRIRQKAYRRGMAVNHRDWGSRNACGYCAS